MDSVISSLIGAVGSILAALIATGWRPRKPRGPVPPLDTGAGAEPRTELKLKEEPTDSVEVSEVGH
ncbi:hypothetical protein GCM10009839_45420 [Catenulispora yoronensis]|uniref:Uncharacterized protein n=1 Tax=Catenulispora yoronensis TaxID=450799 RepID=A0ABN2UJ30_9ACTN